MKIYKPAPKLSEEDKILIQALARVLVEKFEAKDSKSNLPEDYVVLTDEQANNLLNNLNRLINSREFYEKCFLSGQLFSKSYHSYQDQGNKGLRKVYLSGRSKIGKSRVQATLHWADFLSRLGWRFKPYPRRSGYPINIEHFFEMERRLFQHYNLDYRLINLLMLILNNQKNDIEELQSENIEIKKTPLSAIKKIRDNLAKTIKDPNYILLHRIDITSLLIIIVNSSVLYTTRDWSVASVLSMNAGALTTLVKKKKHD